MAAAIRLGLRPKRFRSALEFWLPSIASTPWLPTGSIVKRYRSTRPWQKSLLKRDRVSIPRSSQSSSAATLNWKSWRTSSLCGTSKIID